MTGQRIVTLVPSGYIDRQDHGRVHSVHYPDGTIRIEHQCKVVSDTRFVIAPSLQLENGHTVTQIEPLTVQPSIACPDCGLHGYIIEGAWQDC
jgi:hypothetical protein